MFCNRKRDVDVVAKSLQKHGFNAAPLHGDLDQSVRTGRWTGSGPASSTFWWRATSRRAASTFRQSATSSTSTCRIHPDDYVHRIGRTGRAGRSGHAYMLVTPRDEKYVDQIQRLIGTKIPARKLEGLAEAVEARPQREDRGGRDRNRGKSNRDRKPYPVKPHGQVASMTPAPAAVAAEFQPVAAPAPVRHDHRQDHRQKNQAPPKQHTPRPQQQPREVAEDTRSQLPAFLLRPVKLPTATEKPAPRARKKTAETET